jgi:hypothetical protein
MIQNDKKRERVGYENHTLKERSPGNKNIQRRYSDFIGCIYVALVSQFLDCSKLHTS